MKSKILCTLLMAIVAFQPLPAQELYQSRAFTGTGERRPAIGDIVSAISKDSLAAHMQWLVNMGTRYMYADNHREVSSKIAAKFRSYGYTDVALDSFRVEGEIVPADSVWQYNVIASAAGSSAPGEIYIISAHHDDFRQDGSLLQVPGADDNGSGCAVAIEIARVLKAKGFQPASTIRFVTVAAEELVGYTNMSGSIYYAKKVKDKGEDLRLEINNDMVAYAKDATNTITATAIHDRSSGWAGDLTMASAAVYAPSLTLNQGQFPTSDAYAFYQLGYPVAGFEEFGLNTTYHTVRDSVNNCNMDICLDVARANCAILVSEQFTPVPQQTYSIAGRECVNLCWKPTKNSYVQGYRIYRSTSPGSGFAVIGEAGALDSVYSDSTAKTGLCYYYYVVTFDNQQNESIGTNVFRGSLFPQDRELLVVKDSKGGFNNPSDSAVMACYRQVFRNLACDYSDASVDDSLTIATLGRYKRIFWLSNAYSNEPNSSFRRNYLDITTYLRSGGQLFIDGFQPTFMVTGNVALNRTFLAADTLNRFYKIAKVMRSQPAMLNGATACENGYDSIRIDTVKCPDFPKGHINNLECFEPVPEAKVIYRFKTTYDSTTLFGKMKGKPVGFEYLGNDYKLILLSVPLYYIDTLDARNLATLVVSRKFISHTGVADDPPSGSKSLFLQSVPNPVQNKAMLHFYLPRRNQVHLSVYSAQGREILSADKGWHEAGPRALFLDLSGFQRGSYIAHLTSGNLSGSVVLIKE